MRKRLSSATLVYVLFALLLSFHVLANLWWVARDNHAITCDEQYHMQRTQMWFDTLAQQPEQGLGNLLRAVLDLETRYPPLLYILGSCVCLVFGYSTDALVLTSTFLFLLIVVGVYHIGRLLHGRWMALYVAFVASFLPAVHGFSRSYTTDYLIACIITWAIYALIRSRYYEDTRWVLVFSILNALGFLARPTAFLFYAVPAIVTVALGFMAVYRGGAEERAGGRRYLRLLLNMGLTALVAMVLVAPWYVYHLDFFLGFWRAYTQRGYPIFAVAGRLGGSWKLLLLGLVLGGLLGVLVWSNSRLRAQAATLAMPACFAVFVFLIFIVKSRRWSIYPIHAINNGVFLPAFVVGIAGLFLVCKKNHRQFPFVMNVLWVLGSYVLLTTVLQGTAPRYYLPALPAFAILCVAALAAIPRPRVRHAAMGVFAGLLVFQYGNLTFAPYGAIRRAELPVFSRNWQVRAQYDSGLVLFKDQIKSGSYMLCAPYTEENHIDRIHNAMAAGDADAKGGFTRYQWVNMIGGGFRRGNSRLEINPFLRDRSQVRAVPESRPLRKIGDVYTTPEDLLPRLAETDYVAFRLTHRQLGKLPQWRAFFARRGFRVIDQFDPTRHDMSPYGSRITVMARREPARLDAVKQWDFATLDKGAWEWRFAADARKTPKGALGATKQSGPWATLAGMRLRAEQMTTVRLHATFTQTTDEGEVPVPLDKAYLYWAGPSDIQGDTWPFSNLRAVPFRTRTGYAPGVFEANLVFHDRWTGPIRRVFIGISFPEEHLHPAGKPVKILIQRIEFLR